VAGVTVGSRNTCYRAARYGLTRTGLAPVGLHQLLLAPSEIGASGLKFESTMHMGQVLHRNSATQKSFRISGLVLVQTS
jgi:hypothetical protein